MKKEHKTELKKRAVFYSVCVEPDCKYKDGRAVQGHCFSRLPTAHDRYIQHVMRHGEQLLKEMRGLRKLNGQVAQKKWIQHLEGQVVCMWANSTFNLDELIYLRKENAELKFKLGKHPKK